MGNEELVERNGRNRLRPYKSSILMRESSFVPHQFPSIIGLFLSILFSPPLTAFQQVADGVDGIARCALLEFSIGLWVWRLNNRRIVTFWQGCNRCFGLAAALFLGLTQGSEGAHISGV